MSLPEFSTIQMPNIRDGTHKDYQIFAEAIEKAANEGEIFNLGALAAYQRAHLESIDHRIDIENWCSVFSNDFFDEAVRTLRRLESSSCRSEDFTDPIFILQIAASPRQFFYSGKFAQSDESFNMRSIKTHPVMIKMLSKAVMTDHVAELLVRISFKAPEFISKIFALLISMVEHFLATTDRCSEIMRIVKATCHVPHTTNVENIEMLSKLTWRLLGGRFDSVHTRDKSWHDRELSPQRRVGTIAYSELIWSITRLMAFGNRLGACALRVSNSLDMLQNEEQESGPSGRETLRTIITYNLQSLEMMFTQFLCYGVPTRLEIANTMKVTLLIYKIVKILFRLDRCRGNQLIEAKAAGVRLRTFFVDDNLSEDFSEDILEEHKKCKAEFEAKWSLLEEEELEDKRKAEREESEKLAKIRQESGADQYAFCCEEDRPDAHFCPITKQLMVNPVVAPDGHTYEEHVINKWFSKTNTSPITNLVLPNKTLTPNFALKSIIQTWEKTQHDQAMKNLSRAGNEKKRKR